MKKFLGLDYGTTLIGVASGSSGIAFPRESFQNKGLQADVQHVCDLVEELGVNKIVVGHPLRQLEDLPENQVMAKVKKFVGALEVALPDLEIVLFDERFSTFEGEELMRDLREKGADTELSDDAFAAQVILQRFFDKEGA